MSDTIHDLSDVTFEEIWDELYKRYGALLIVTERKSLNRTPDDENVTETQVYYKGSMAHAMGLAAFAEFRIAMKVQEDE